MWIGVLLSFACQQSGLVSVGDVHKDGGTGNGDGGHPRQWPPERPGYVNPVPAENQLSGDPSWSRGFNRSNRGQIDAYADRVSASAGDTVQLMVRSDRIGASASWALFRLGWYGGAGARRILGSTQPLSLGDQPACPPDPATGLVRCSWMPSFTVSLPPDAVSGLYVVRIVRDDAFAALIPLVVLDAEGKPGTSEGTVYTAPSGALVFRAGSIFWARGVDGPVRDARVERMTANLLKLGLDLPVPAALSSVSGGPSDPPSGMWASSVRTVAGGMSGPTGVAQLPDGTFVIADARGHRIWQTNGAGTVWPYAGDGHPNGSSRFDNVPGLSARFFAPTAVLPDAAGNIYVADTHNCVIRKIGNDARRTVTTVAGAFMVEGYADGIGAAARFGLPMGMAWLDSTHVVIADSSSAAIRVLDVQTRAVTTLAVSHGPDERDGPGLTAASFQRPTAVAVAPDGRIFFVASPSGTVKMIGTDASRTVTTLVAGGLGFADGPGTGARLLPQMGLLWLNGALIVSDPGNQRLRWVSPGATAGSTTVKTWAGNGRSGTDDGSGSAAAFEVPLGLCNSKDGNVYVVDGTAGTLRAVRP